jgi:RNA polymerase sigma-70 factor (ECF subfamily)
VQILGRAPRSRSGLPTRTVAAVESSPFEPAVAPLYAGLVRRLVLVLGDADEAQDIAQDAYLQAFRAWGRFDGSDVRAWLYTIALRLAFNQMRRRRRWLAAIRRVDPKPWRDPADPDLWAALQDLDPRTRSALLLNVVDGYTQVEIAEMLSVPVGTVSSWISRGRTRLREALTPSTDGADGRA